MKNSNSRGHYKLSGRLVRYIAKIENVGGELTQNEK